MSKISHKVKLFFYEYFDLKKMNYVLISLGLLAKISQQMPLQLTDEVTMHALLRIIHA